MTLAHPNVRARYAIDPVAFFIALFGAPVLVAILGFWALAIPIFALFMGGPIYLIVGTPVLLIYLHHREGDTGTIVLLALGTTAIGSAFFVILGLWVPGFERWDNLFGLIPFALLFSALWGAVFGALYRKLRSPASRRPLPAFQ